MSSVPKHAAQSGARGSIAAVTGATGFLGRYVISALARSGWQVRMLVRSEPMHEQISNLNTEITLGDLNDEPALRHFCSGADAIIHLAGAIKARDRESFFVVNSKGSENLARAAAAKAPGVPIVHISSMAAREPELSDYAASKRAGEEALRKKASGPLIILRPSAVYGPWDEATKPLFQMAAKGWVLSPRVPSARVCLIHAQDVADAVVSAVQNETSSATYELTDSTIDGYTWHEIATAAGKVMGRQPRIIDVPPWAFKLGGLISGLSSPLMRTTPILTRGKVREMLHLDWTSHQQNQPPETWWRAKVNLLDGFNETANWYLSRKFD